MSRRVAFAYDTLSLNRTITGVMAMPKKKYVLRYILLLIGFSLVGTLVFFLFGCVINWTSAIVTGIGYCFVNIFVDNWIERNCLMKGDNRDIKSHK